MRVLAAIVLLQSLAGPAMARPQTNLAGLIPASDVIVAAEIADTDYSRTPSDGPMTARARVLAVVKGRLRRAQVFTFSETAWVGPSYQKGEVRILFIESAGPNAWRILPNTHSRMNFFIERDAISLLNISSLRRALERSPAPSSRGVIITKGMLR
jgi:hypothetical protein